MMIACRCVCRTRTVMRSLWARHVEDVHASRVKERACLPAVLKSVHTSRVKERAYQQCESHHDD